MQTGIIDETVKSPSLIVEKYFDMVYRLARKLAGADKADDAVQNVFMRYISHSAEFTEEEHVKAWLIRVTYNCCRSELKNSWTERTTGLPEYTERERGLAAEPEETDIKSALRAAVDMLSPKYRAVIHLYYYEGYTAKEIAEMTGQKEVTVRSIMHRGRRKLEKILKEGQFL